MVVRVNGEDQPLPDGCTVRQLLDRMQLPPERVAVELNRRLLRSAGYDTALKESDQVEVVTFVGGG